MGLERRWDSDNDVFKWYLKEMANIESEEDEDEDELTFSFNLAPDGFEGVMDYKELHNQLEIQIKFLKEVQKFVAILNLTGHEVRAEGDFYWSEGDLMIRVYIKKPVVTPRINLEDIRGKLEHSGILDNVVFVESEGENVLRVDFNRGENSVWVHSDGQLSGKVTPRLKKFISKLIKT